MPARHLFTSESVTEGHPDKVADQISDGILDAFLTEDSHARVACETLVSTNLVLIAGEITSSARVDVAAVARDTIRRIGYIDHDIGFDCDHANILVSLKRQSPDIARGVDRGGDEQGAGDQGLMFGFACADTPEFMPLPIHLAHRLTRRLAEVRHKGILNFLRPDGKSQVTIEYRDRKPFRVDSVVVSTHHRDDVSDARLRDGIETDVVRAVVPAELMDRNTRILVNPTGRFVVGGPLADVGLTGRKIIVDSYGGHGSHGGGAFSGKDPSKVDRSASYMARYVAKQLVAAGLAQRCELQVAYAIGVADPMSIMVDTKGTGTAPDEHLAELVGRVFSMRPAAIIRQLDLLRPIYQQTASYGHFGRNEPGFTWERTDRVEDLKRAAGM
ncbi:MAG: metK-1 [Deltaproteobacteria bacterium]|nr:metK-1 [Deltaproteobacteria bacterium]